MNDGLEKKYLFLIKITLKLTYFLNKYSKRKYFALFELSEFIMALFSSEIF